MHDYEEDQAAGLSSLKGRRVLLAEDNITNQMVATQMLDALGMRVDVANDGAEALEMIDRRQYDLYLIDIEMPRVSGLDVIRGIRKAPPPLCEAPIIAVTAYALREHRDKIAEAGADGLIPKPLIGIEQFGRDILGFIRSPLRGSSDDDALTAVGAKNGGGTDDVDLAAESGGPVSMPVFNALAEAIGPAAMVDLLAKIDADLDAANTEVAMGSAEGSNKKICAATHILVSITGAVGAQELQRLAQRLNAVANGRAEGDIETMVQDIVSQVTTLRAFLKAHTKETQG